MFGVWEGETKKYKVCIKWTQTWAQEEADMLYKDLENSKSSDRGKRKTQLTFEE